MRASTYLAVGLAAALCVPLAGCLAEFPAPPQSGDGGFAGVDAAGSDGGFSPGVPYHPPGYSAASVHGTELKYQKQDCRSCHGTDLSGGASGVSCDGCHTPASWRTTCTFCHGGTDNQTGAPPRHLDGTNAPASAKFAPHSKHVGSTLSAAVDCMQCHVKATDVLSPGHVFDSTPGVAETDFGAGLSKQGAWDRASGTCATLYCHGDGRGDNGTVTVAAGPRNCASCHPSLQSGAAAWANMSGAHSLHLSSTTQGGAACADCHNTVTTDSATIASPALHVDGLREVAFSAAAQPGFAFDPVAQSCTGTCHGYTHTSKWLGGGGAGGRFHPAGYSAPTMHGPDMELQRMDCRGCHAADLKGNPGLTGYDAPPPSCDTCHQAGWRSNCVYCHGGGVNQTGAPPRDLAAAQSTVSQSFRAHTAHVTQSISAASDCTTCHLKPTDVLSVNHAFDSTPAKAEVTLAAGLSPAGTYDGKGTCANLYCHGTGLVNGTYTDGSATPSCGGCHAGMASGSTAWSTMSGSHRRHLGLGNVTCADCHNTVTTTGTTITAPLLHVDGKRQVAFTVSGFTWDANTRTCTGICHAQDHNGPW